MKAIAFEEVLQMILNSITEKRNKIKNFVGLAALMVLITVPNYLSVFFSIFIILIYMLKIGLKTSYVNNTNSKFIYIKSALISSYLAYRFYINWKNSLLIEMVLGILKVSKRTSLFVLIIAILCDALSIEIIANIVDKIYTKKKEKSVANTTKIDILFSIIMAAYIMMSINCRPFSNYFLDTDSSVYMYIGKAMTNNFIPYKDIFDHKGIILYLFNYLGFLISDKSYFGIMIVCGLNAFLFSLIMIKLLKLNTKNRSSIYISIFWIFNLFAFKLSNATNSTEVFSLPWISLSLYASIKFLMYKKICSKDVVLLGTSFAIVFFLRCNNVACIIALILCILVELTKNRRFEDIYNCVKYFIFGVLLIVIPLLMYFIATNSLADMINDYFIFNFVYTESFGSQMNIINVAIKLSRLVIDPIVVLIYILFEKDDKKWNILFVLLFTVFFASISGRTYHHYANIILPVYGIILNDMISKTIDYLSTGYDEKMLLLLTIISISVLVGRDVYYNKPFKTTTYARYDEVDQFVLTNTSENDDVLFIGNNVRYNLFTNRNTRNKYVYQTPPIDLSENVYNDFIDEILKIKSDYIVFVEKNENIHSVLSNIQEYKHFEYDKFCVFKLINNMK